MPADCAIADTGTFTVIAGKVASTGSRGHPWRVSAAQAAAIQERLARQVLLTSYPTQGHSPAGLAAGVDVAYSKDGAHAFAAAVVMDSSFSAIASFACSGEPDRPYTPGFLAFREGRLSIEALAGVIEATKLATGEPPDIIFLDGHGIVHERGLGLASHVGVLMDLPTVGVPKTPFHAIDHLPDEPRGSFYVLTKEWGAEGAALRLRTGVKPVYVSPGHRMDLDSAIRLCLEWSTGKHKVPEPLAAAHTLSVRVRNGAVDAPASRR